MKLNLINEIKTMEKALENARNNITLLPHGSLRCTSSNGVDQFYIDGQYISKKRMDVIKGVAQREYYEHLVPAIERELGMLKAFYYSRSERVIENVFMEQCSARKKIVTPAIEPIEAVIERFMAEQYKPGEFDEDDKTEYYTVNHERVRSKSEQHIANELARYKVPYRYEKPLELLEWGEIVTVRPDFTVLNVRTREIFLLEHLGMMDSISYINRNMTKFDTYERNGYLIGKNLICTHETSTVPLSSGVLDNYIKTFFV